VNSTITRNRPENKLKCIAYFVDLIKRYHLFRIYTNVSCFILWVAQNVKANVQGTSLLCVRFHLCLPAQHFLHCTAASWKLGTESCNIIPSDFLLFDILSDCLDRRIFCPMILGGLGNDWLGFWVLPVPQIIKLVNFHFSASNSVAVVRNRISSDWKDG